MRTLRRGAWIAAACGAALSTASGAAGASAEPVTSAPDACALLPAAAVAHDLGQAQILEHDSSTPDTASGGRLTSCRIVAWSGNEPSTSIAKGNRARLNIETTEEDSASPFASNWAKAGAAEARAQQEETLIDEAMFASGYYTRSNVGYALWDRRQVEGPTFNTTANGVRNIFATWRSSTHVGRTLTLNIFLSENARAFAELNAIAEAALTAFTTSPGEFGAPGAPAPEPRALTPAQRFHACPGTRAKSDGQTYEHFEVRGGVTCARARALMNAFLAAGGPLRPPRRRIEGWSFAVEAQTLQVTASKGAAQFICVPREP